MPDQVVMLTISFVPGEPMQINGPVHDKMLCYSMLEMAKDAIRDHHAKSSESRIFTPRFDFDQNGNEK